MKKEYRILSDLYCSISDKINSRIKDFDKIREESDNFRIFQEMCFCLLTPQSKAEKSWEAILSLTRDNLLKSGNTEEIKPYLRSVRFFNNKALNIVLAREKFFNSPEKDLKNIIHSFNNSSEARDFFVKQVRGYGMKETSHFLRNCGAGYDLAILDRHIMKNLLNLGIISDLPASLNKKSYLLYEEKMRTFSAEINVPMHHLDLLFWYRAKGNIFK